MESNNFEYLKQEAKIMLLPVFVENKRLDLL